MTHREIIELLPWYVNSTLAEQERTGIDAHLAACPDCRKQVETLQAIREAEIELNEAAPVPSPFLLTRALEQIDVLEARPRTWLHALFSWWSPTPRLARAVMAAQLALLVCLAGFTGWRERSFTTLTGPSGSGVKIVVGFEPGATEEQLRQTLREIDGEIVAGPSALNLYTVRVGASAGEVERLLEKLRQNRAVIRHAERQL